MDTQAILDKQRQYLWPNHILSLHRSACRWHYDGVYT